MAVTQDYRNFKQLLEYFVAHLEYCHFDLVTRNGQDLRSEKSSGYDKYIKPFIDKGIFAKKGKYIDERIKDWIYYDNIKLGLEIKTTSGKYQSNGYFINCGRINIQANWTENRITDLYVTKYINHNNYEQLYAPVSIQDLGLFDEQEPNENLVNFYKTYFDYIKNEDNMNNSTSNSNNNFVEEVKNLLLQTKNLILTGAPGTGKTYLAKQIADELTNNDNECVSMVQFHPSYDYTDFVEGLRPIDNGNGEIGFERKDGEFKKFCKEALINSTTQSNSIQEFDIAWRKLIEEIENKLLENGEKTKIANVEYDLSRNRTLRAHPTYFTLTKENIFKAYQGQKAREKGGHQNYMNQVVDYLKTNYNLPDYKENDITEDAHIQATSTEQQNFVFIIDEINRGEISKIFGELFYAIDPGYRGKNGRIKTQYQNLLEGTDDTFEEGFYVPENVYIIGTMNDIDRSVDSFDFAMRRRFAWKEITAEDTQHSILDSLQDDKRNEAINRMNSLNKAISEMPELGTQYQLGASYFLKLEHYDYDFEKLWHFHIKGLLYEYLRGVPGADSKLADLKKAYEPENEQ